jgi:hypothetical protein
VIRQNKNLSHPSLVIYFSATPQIKPKVGHQIGGGTTNSKSLGAIIMMSQSETLSRNQIICITLLALLRLLQAIAKLYKYHEPKPFS